jgi:hypothetical protein
MPPDLLGTFKPNGFAGMLEHDRQIHGCTACKRSINFRLQQNQFAGAKASVCGDDNFGKAILNSISKRCGSEP